MNPFLDQELGWLEIHLAQLKAYLDANPICCFEDRYATVNGRMVITATIETQAKNIGFLLKMYSELVEAINHLKNPNG